MNILGLTLGFTSFLLILFFVNHELSFDRFHTNQDHVYRINFTFTDNSGNATSLVNSPPALAPALNDFPEVSKVSRRRYTANCLLSNGERSFYEEFGYYADSLFLEILAFEFVSGNPLTAREQSKSIVWTEKMSEKYFGEAFKKLSKE